MKKSKNTANKELEAAKKAALEDMNNERSSRNKKPRPAAKKISSASKTRRKVEKK
jgi:hypothetical protein